MIISKLNPLIIQQFGQLFHDRIGLNPEFITRTVWNRIIRQRMTACGVSELGEYLKLVINNPKEFQEVIELVVIPETWFFRDRPSVDFSLDFLRKETARYGTSKKFHLLSLPCSTGEEPYSIAMALIERGMAHTYFLIDAFDISQKAIQKAEIGIYRKNSFRGADINYKDRFFEETSAGYKITMPPRRYVTFAYNSIFDLHLPDPRIQYDVIFCRNLLIYFHHEAQKKTLSILKTLIADEGILVVGPAEVELVRSNGWSPVGPYNSCAFSLTKSEVMQL